MSKSFIKFGSINKKFLLPFLLAISEVAYIIFNKYYPVKDVNSILHAYSMAFGEMSIKLLPYILKISDNDIIQRNKRLTTKRKCLHYAILSLLYVFTLGINGGANVYEALVMGKEKSIAERVKLAYMAALTEGKGNVSNHLDDELKKEFGNGNYTLASNLSKVTIDGKDYYFDGTVTPGSGGGEKQTVADLRAAAISNGVTPLSTTDTTTIKDNKNNEIKVPKGFGIATDSGINVAEGIVIEDATHEGTTKGSQFVWVPVDTITKTDGSTETITLKRYVFNTSTGAVDESLSKTEPSDHLKTSSSLTYYYTEGLINDTTSNTHAKDIATFLSSANSNKGYYIARYEAGIDASKDQYAYANCSGKGANFSCGYSLNMFAKDGSVKPLSIRGKGIWNAVTQGEASTISRNMYNTINDKVTSDLVNSYAWDTAILFIQKCGNNGEDSSKYSIQRGYSALNTNESQTAGNNKLAYQPGGTTERETAIFDTQCKICDMAGNVSEWTTERSSGTNGSYTDRGGSYDFTVGYTTIRKRDTSDGCCFPEIGFRPILYL